MVRMTNPQIAYALGVSVQTVKNHITHIGLRLSIDANRLIEGRTALLLYAIWQKWIPLEEALK